MAEKDAKLFDKINGVPYYILPALPEGTIRLQNMGKPTVYIETDSEETLRACFANENSGDKTVETCRATFNNTLVNFRGEPFLPDFIVDAPTVKLGPRTMKKPGAGWGPPHKEQPECESIGCQPVLENAVETSKGKP